MDVKDLNRAQLLLLAILLSFITSIVTGITTVTLLERTPSEVIVPINRVIKHTVEKIVPDETKTVAALSPEEKKLLEDLKAIKPLTVSLFQREEGGDKILGTGLFLGDNKVVIATVIPLPASGEEYIVKSVLGEQKVSKVSQEEDFTIIELAKTEVPQLPETPTEEATNQ